MAKTTLVQIRMEAAEKRAAQKKARAKGLSLSAWLRLLAATATILTLLSARPASALDPWTWQDTAWEGGFALTLALDYGQTTWAMKHRNDWQETNQILGKYPSQPRLIGYNLSVLALHAGVAALLPKQARRAWQVLAIGFEGYHVANNWRIGVRFTF